MKKYIASLLILVVFVTGCTSSSDSDTVLPKKIVEQDDLGYNSTYTYSYDDDRLMGISKVNAWDEHEITLDFSYDAGKLVRIDDTLTGDYFLFHYDADGTLLDIVKYEPGWDHAEKSTFEFTATGMNIHYATGSLANQNNNQGTEYLTVQNGNITEEDFTDTSFQITYDSKNAPFKNISNFQVIQCWFYSNPSGCFGKMFLNRNNALALSYSPNYGWVYTYNSNNYPISFYRGYSNSSSQPPASIITY